MLHLLQKSKSLKSKSLKSKIMKIQKELTVRQIKLLFKKCSIESGEPLEQTTVEVLKLLQNEQHKELIYNLYNAFKTRTRLTAQLKRRDTLTAYLQREK